MQHHFTTQSLNRVDLELGRGQRHDDDGTRAQFGRAHGHSLRMVAGRRANHALRQLLSAQVGHLVVGATQLETEDGLLVFALKQHFVVNAPAQIFGRLKA